MLRDKNHSPEKFPEVYGQGLPMCPERPPVEKEHLAALDLGQLLEISKYMDYPSAALPSGHSYWKHVHPALS